MCKRCQVCGYEYKDGANVTTIMKHIKEAHMGDEDKELGRIKDLSYADLDPNAMADSVDGDY